MQVTSFTASVFLELYGDYVINYRHSREPTTTDHRLTPAPIPSDAQLMPSGGLSALLLTCPAPDRDTALRAALRHQAAV